MKTGLLEARNITARFGGVTALTDCTVSVCDGLTGLIGPNGAGKSSLVDVLTGYHRPAVGTVTFNGADIGGLSPHERARRGLVRTFQAADIFDGLTVSENVMVAVEQSARVPRRSRRGTAAEALSQVGLLGDASAPADSLTHGQRKLLALARALACRPAVLLLDEPAAGLDSDETVVLGERLQVLSDSGVAILLIDHDLDLIHATCTDVIVLDFGSVIYHGNTTLALSDPRVSEAYLGRAANTPAKGDQS
jgi:branched-chain amino acid transport system ATP-binding protein